MSKHARWTPKQIVDFLLNTGTNHATAARHFKCDVSTIGELARRDPRYHTQYRMGKKELTADEIRILIRKGS